VKLYIYLFMALILFAGSTTAQWNEGEERRPVPDTAWSASAGGLVQCY